MLVRCVAVCSVKMGIHKETKERVALKMLRKDKLTLSDESIKKQVEREITAMTKIQHKNVIRLKFVDWEAKFERANGTKVDVVLVVLELATGMYPPYPPAPLLILALDND